MGISDGAATLEGRVASTAHASNPRCTANNAARIKERDPQAFCWSMSVGYPYCALAY
jgi:hypothetical protein